MENKELIMKVSEIVDLFIKDEITNNDVQDILEGFSIRYKEDFEELYTLFNSILKEKENGKE